MFTTYPSTGYCYDCKKQCSVVNLSQDKLSPDIAFYFKDPINLFQKMIEIENFQKLHRNRCMESAMKERYIEDILLLKAWRERAEKYLPYLGQICSALCAKYGIKPDGHCHYSDEDITAFVDRLKAECKQWERFQGTPNAMEVDGRLSSQSSRSTPMVQGSPAWSVRSGVGGAMTTPSSMLRARIHSEMHADSAPMSVRRATPIGGSGGGCDGVSVQSGGGCVTPVGLQRRQVTPPGGRGIMTTPIESRGVRVVPSGGSQYTVRATPTGSRYSAGRITPTSGNRPSPLLSSSRAIASRAFSPHAHGSGASRGPAASSSPSTSQLQQPHPPRLQPTSALMLPTPSSSATPTHAQIRQAMLSGGSHGGSQVQGGYGEGGVSQDRRLIQDRSQHLAGQTVGQQQQARLIAGQSQDRHIQSQDRRLQSQQDRGTIQDRSTPQGQPLPGQTAGQQPQGRLLQSQDRLLQSQDRRLQSQDRLLQTQNRSILGQPLAGQTTGQQQSQARLQTRDPPMSLSASRPLAPMSTGRPTLRPLVTPLGLRGLQATPTTGPAPRLLGVPPSVRGSVMLSSVSRRPPQNN